MTWRIADLRPFGRAAGCGRGMDSRETEDTLSAALPARASSRPTPSQRTLRPGPTGVRLLVIVLGLLSGLLAADATTRYPNG
ncbi:hypothetical protein [Saccharopolyspora aridisoli]|uniref:hypothetical protein n=1 Tax=Saccharopolyspora aridisoli TaxID=2530385 RepID=UPI001A9CF20F|nr:hypothetical protein [Saccharopolyspora aridisoli]